MLGPREFNETMRKLFNLAFIVLLSPMILSANAYKESMEHLQVEDPEFLLHVDLKNDFHTLGELLSRAYLEYLKTSPETPPIPISYEALFNRLGLGNVESMTLVSERLEKGFFNQALTRFNESPRGLFTIAGTENEPFSILQGAPVDAGMLLEASMNMPALLEVLRNVAIDLMGATGQGLVDAQLVQPVTEDGLTWLDIINRLQTRVQFAARLPGESSSELPAQLAMLEAMAALRLQGIGDLLPRLSPMLEGIGFQPVGGAAQAWDLRMETEWVPVYVRIQALPESNDLLLTYSEGADDWFLGEKGIPEELERLMEQWPDMPRSGLSLWFDDGTVSEMQIRNMWKDMEVEEKYEPLLAVLQDFLMQFTGSQLAVGVAGESYHHAMAIQPSSYKTNLATAAIVVPVAMGIGFTQAMEASQPVQEETTNPEDVDSAAD